MRRLDIAPWLLLALLGCGRLGYGTGDDGGPPPDASSVTLDGGAVSDAGGAELDSGLDAARHDSGIEDGGALDAALAEGGLLDADALDADLGDAGAGALDASDGAVTTTDAAPGDAGRGGALAFGPFAAGCPGMVLNGSATCVGGVVQITPAAIDRAGSAFLDCRTTIAFGESFSILAHVRFHDPITPTAADGMALVIQRDPRGSAALGTGGGGLGLGGFRSIAAIEPSIAFVLDIFDHTSGTAVNTFVAAYDGDLSTPVMAMTPALSFLDPAGVWIEVHLDGATSELSAGVRAARADPFVPQIAFAIDTSAEFGDGFWIGVTSSTGTGAIAQDLVSLEVAFDATGLDMCLGR